MIKKTIFSILIIYVFALVLPLNNFFNKSVHADNNKNRVFTGLSNKDNLQFSEKEKQWIKDHPVVRARIGTAPPLHFFEGSPKGISVDYLNLIAGHAGFQVKYITGIPWSKAIDSIKNHEKIDLILTAKITEERKKFISFTDNYLIIPLVIFTRNEIGFISGIEDLKHKTVSVERGYVLHSQLMDQFPEIDLHVVEKPIEAIKAVATGKADAYIGNLTITTYIIRQNNLNNLKIAAPTPFDNHNQAMAIRDDWPQLASIINKSFKSLTPEEHEAIKNRWMKVRYEYGVTKFDLVKWILIFGIFSMIIIGIIMFWNRRLKKEIIQREKSEKTLLENEIFIKSVMDNLPIGIAVNSVDPTVDFSYMNDNFPKYYRTTRQKLADPDIFWESVYEDPVFREQIKNKILNDCATDNPKNMYWPDVPITRKGDGTSYVSARNIPIPDKQLMISTVWDVTHRKHVEEALKENERKYKMLIENLPQKIFYKDKNSVYVTCNKNFANDLKIKPEEITGKTDNDFFTKKLAGKYRLDDKRIIESGGTEEIEEEYVLDNKSYIVQTVKTAVPDNKGNVVGLLGIFWDITKHRQLEGQLQQAQKMEAIGTLAGGIAHDFNNILFPLMGYAEMLKEDLPQDSPHQKSIAEIFQAALRAKELVKQILAFSRQGDRKLKAVKLQSVLKEALKLLGSSIPKTIDIQTDIDCDCGLVIADPTQIHQIIMNLATNAFHAMQKSGGQLKIILTQTLIESNQMVFTDLIPGKYALLKVMDTGTGIEKNVIDKIFDPYFTTKPKDKGTGLGLSVVKGIAKSCNGDIHVYSEPGKGTEIHVYLPIMKKSSDNGKSDPVQPIQGGTERIILVDDEESIIKMEKKMLKRLGYHVTSRTVSSKALEIFKANPDNFDLIITDMTMPGMTGVQLANEIRDVRKDIPVIICSGFSDQINEKNSKEFGIQGYIAKPVIKRELAKTIRDILDNLNG
ncbi:MAG: transporter substrate-binding domain-containing protein [Desulfobacula sp.]|nr:transporter substrate-binding domain-containing protein [Desulfobacula sp.]